eukprot:jgi/Ulvmu1/1857/UM012_0013.1
MLLVLTSFCFAALVGAKRTLSNVNEDSYPKSCLDHSDCRLVGAHGSYCYTGTSNFIQHASDSTCLGCWACCLYKTEFTPFQDLCPSWCNCSLTGSCSAPDECASGHFCDQVSGACQPCSDCTSDASVAGSGTCSDTCPYGPSGAVGALFSTMPSMELMFTYLSYQANDAFQQYSPSNQSASQGVNVEAFGDWLEATGINLQGDRAPYVFANFDADNDSLLTVKEYVDKRLEPGDHLCHSADDVNQAAVAFAGCPCNPISSPSLGACPPGFLCSHTGDGLGETRGDSPSRFFTTTTARCIPCARGDFCPRGTYSGADSAANSQLAERRCPPGSYCPSPRERVTCVAGTYCVAGSLEPFSCDFGGLVMQNALAEVPQPQQTVIQQLYENGGPMAGNFCPEKSVSPTSMCAPGYYCPSASEQIICPRGSFCPEQSQAPRNCVWLTSCPEGTVRPQLSLGAFVFVAAAAAIMLASFIYVRSAVTGQRARAAEAAEQELLNMVKTLLLRLGRTYGDGGTRGLMIQPMVRIQFKGVSMALKGSNRFLLENVSGVYNPGHLHAIMGPSGCGKTSLLTALSGKAVHGQLHGIIRYNGEPMAPQEVRELVGYVPQDDTVHEDLTVLENIYLAKNLRGGFKAAREGQGVVNEVLDDLYLTRVKDSIVGSVESRGISGGQRKRVNIALEVVGMPSILYLDEPTSGLDATSSIDVLRSLSRLAGCGMNVVTVIHQPRYALYELLDSLLLLGVGGVTVYNGPPLLTQPYFRLRGFAMRPHDNIADFNLDVVSGRVSKAGDPFFKKERLPELWELHGQEFLNMHTAAQSTAWRDSFRLPPEVRRRLFDEFQAADEDGSGALDAKELSALFRKLGIVVPPAVFENMTRELGNAQGQVTCAQLLLALEGVPEDAPDSPPEDASRALATAANTAFDSVSVEHPSGGVAADSDPDGDSGSDSGRLPPALNSDAAAATRMLRLQPAAEDTQHGPERSSMPRTVESSGPGGTSLLWSDSRSRRSGSWSLSEAESLPAQPSAGHAVQPPPPSERMVALENVTFDMRRGAADSSSPSSAESDDVTISGVVRAGDPSAAAAAHVRAMRAEAGLTGRLSGPGTATGTLSRGLISTSDHTQYEDTSGLVGEGIVGGTVNRFLDGSGRGVGEGLEWARGGRAAEIQLSQREHAPPPRHLQAQALRNQRGAPRSARTGHAVGEGVAFDETVGSSADVSQQLRSHPARSSGERAGIARRLFGSRAHSNDGSGSLAADLVAGDRSSPMNKSMVAGTMRRMMASVGDAESGMLGSVRDSLAQQVPPNQLLQLLLIIKRTALKRFRDFFPTTVIDISLLLAAACVVGAIHGTDWQLQQSPGQTVMAATTLCTLTSATFLRSFTREQQMYWREASKGLRTLPYFLGISFIDMYYVILAPLLFVGPYWHLTLPAASITRYYLVCLAITFWSSGAAYALSALLPRHSVLVGTVFTSLIIGAFLSGTAPTLAAARGTPLEAVLLTSYSRWAMEALAITEAQATPSHLQNQTLLFMNRLGVCDVDKLYINNGDQVLDQEEADALLRLLDFQLSDCTSVFWQCLIWILLQGLVLRITALAGLQFGNRAKKA